MKMNDTDGFEEIKTSDPKVLKLLEMARRVARSNSNVLITGESGTGKELIARGIHRISPRSKGPFVAVNCGAIPGDLIESELMGYERGAFTGAINMKVGDFESAHGGTIFWMRYPPYPYVFRPSFSGSSRSVNQTLGFYKDNQIGYPYYISNK